jgi:SET domain-containing protein
VWFVSTRPILKGEELLFDYGDNYWDDPAEYGGGEEAKEGEEEEDQEDEEEAAAAAEEEDDDDVDAGKEFSDDPAYNWAL